MTKHVYVLHIHVSSFDHPPPSPNLLNPSTYPMYSLYIDNRCRSIHKTLNIKTHKGLRTELGIGLELTKKGTFVHCIMYLSIENTYILCI